MDNTMVLLTGALVIITAYYAYQTRVMVGEMREARLAALRPRLVPVVEYDSVRRGTVYVENIGAGPALNVEIVLTFEPNGTSFTLSRYLLRSGDRRFWNPAHAGDQESTPQEYHPDAQLPHHTNVHLTGWCDDLRGRRHEVNERTIVLNKWEMLNSPIRKAAAVAAEAARS